MPSSLSSPAATPGIIKIKTSEILQHTQPKIKTLTWATERNSAQWLALYFATIYLRVTVFHNFITSQKCSTFLRILARCISVCFLFAFYVYTNATVLAHKSDTAPLLKSEKYNGNGITSLSTTRPSSTTAGYPFRKDMSYDLNHRHHIVPPPASI